MCSGRICVIQPRMTLKLSKIAQISMNATDLDRATAFYRDTLGMKHLFNAPGMSFFDVDGIRLMLGRAEKPEFNHPGSVLYYKVDDIQAAHASLVEKNVKIEGAPHKIAAMPTYDLWMCFFRDTEGNLLALTSEVPRP